MTFIPITDPEPRKPVVAAIEVWHVLGVMTPARRGAPRRFHVLIEATDDASAVKAAIKWFAETRINFIGNIANVHRCHGIERELAQWTKAICERARSK